MASVSRKIRRNMCKRELKDTKITPKLWRSFCKFYMKQHSLRNRK